MLDAGGVSATLEAVNGNCWRDKPHDRAGSSKFMGHSRTAVATGVTVRVNVCHLAQELLICAGALTRFPLAELVISGSGHPESFAEFGNRKVLPLRIDQRIPLCGSSESMLTAFFTRYEPWVDARLPLEGASALSLHDGHGPLAWHRETGRVIAERREPQRVPQAVHPWGWPRTFLGLEPVFLFGHPHGPPG